MSRLRGYQTKIVNGCYEAWHAGHKTVMPVCATGSGKCLGKDTPVLMFDGTVKMVQDIRQGELLMGPDSRARRVLSTCSGVEALYRVSPTKGDSYVVNESHILSLKNTLRGDVRNIDVRDYLATNKNFKHLHKGWRVGVDFSRKQQHLALTPYMLGLWLGDGSSATTAITTMDHEIVTHIHVYAAALGMSVSDQKCGGYKARTYHITCRKRGGCNPLRDALRHYDLLNNKHIPHDYLCGDRDQRLWLLAGLLDSDGHYTNGYYDLISKWKHLAEQIAFLARSLGLAAYVKECQKSAGQGHSGTYWRLSISGELSDIPCQVERQKPQPRKQKKDVLRTAIAVEPIGVGDYYGFEIDGDRLFLLGDFTVTHNTVMMAEVFRNYTGPSVAMAHRGVLVGQISLALAREEIPHDIIGSKAVTRTIVQSHLEDMGRSWYNPSARCRVASVDTLKNRTDLYDWMKTVGFAAGDEGHHFLMENKWGRAWNMFPNAKWMLPTATPERADGKGLGIHADGVVDAMVEGPPMRWLIDNGYLTDYKYRGVIPSDLDLSDVGISADGDYNAKDAARSVKRSNKIVGDIVDTYCQYTPGKLAIVFAADIEHAQTIANAFNERGVTAALVSGDMSEEERRPVMRKFKAREIKVLVNVDLFGEGYDLPAIEVVIFARPTMSYSLFAQQWGRALRLMISKLLQESWDSYTASTRLDMIARSEKPFAFIHDHVGNLLTFGGPPDRPRKWSLDRRTKRSTRNTDAIPLRICVNGCQQPYERSEIVCPYCGTPAPEPAQRSRPEHVDGDLPLYTSEMLMELFGCRTLEEAQQKADMSTWQPGGAPSGDNGMIAARRQREFNEKITSQQKLRMAMSLLMPPSIDQRVNDKRFFLKFGVDTLNARLLGSKDADELRERILESIVK